MKTQYAIGNLLRALPGAAHFFHHLVVALIVASVVTLLHAWGMLGWLDAAMLNSVGAGRQDTESSAESAPDMPYILTIGPRYYEEGFQQSSPLEPGRLAALLSALPTDSGKPRQIVFDIDMSPVSKDDLNSSSRTQLDGVLRKFIDAGIAVVIPAPVRVTSETLIEAKGEWLARLCKFNTDPERPLLRIAPAHIRENLGRVLQFDPQRFSLGSIAAQTISSGASGRDATLDAAANSICRNLTDDSVRWRCPYLSASFHESVFDQRDPALHTKLFPFNAQFFRALDRHLLVADSKEDVARLLEQHRGEMAGRTLFVGGGYDEHDRFLTPLDVGGRTEGVAVHAASFYSILHPVSHYDGLRAFAIDVVLGLLFAYLFERTWGFYRTARHATEESQSWSRYLKLRWALFFNFGLMLILVSLCMWLAAVYLFPKNIWINPGPVVLGMFVKFAIASRADAHGHGDWRPAAARWMETGGIVCLIGWAIWMATHH